MDYQALERQKVSKLLLKYSLPAIIGMLVAALYNVVDRIFIGNIEGIGADAISGVGVTMPITTIMLAFSMLVGLGATSNISLCLGRGEKEKAQRLLGHTFTLTLLAAALLTAVGLLFCDDILRLFGASDVLLPYARRYITIILGGSVFNMMAYTINSTIRADGSPIIAGVTMIIGCALNCVLDPLLIFGFGWGIEGAAIATIFSQFVSCLWVLWYYLRGKSRLTLTISDMRLHWQTVKLIFITGLSPFSMQISFSIIQAITNIRLSALGSEAGFGDMGIGAFAVVSSVVMLFLMPLFGLGQGVQPIVGYNYGRRLYGRAKKTLWTAVTWSSIYLLIGFAIIEIFPGFFISLFNDDPGLVAMSMTGLRYDALSIPLLGFVVLGTNLFQFIGKPRVALLLNVTRQFFFLIPCLLILPNFIGIDGVWLSTPICDGVAFFLVLVSVVYVMRRMGKDDALSGTLIDFDTSAFSPEL